MTNKIILIASIVLGILIICSSFALSINNSGGNNIGATARIGEISYRGKYLIPVENLVVVTSMFGYREGRSNCIFEPYRNRPSRHGK